MQTDLLFVTGAHKSSTSTLVGFLNSHPEIFVGYEMNVCSNIPSKYSKRFLKHFPQAHQYFRYNPNYCLPYRQLSNWLKQQGYSYRYLGDKIPTLNPDILSKTNSSKTIFIVRDLESWLLKDFIQDLYLTRHNVVPAACDLVSFLIKSRVTPNVLVLSMHEFLYSIDDATLKIADFLKLDASDFKKDWFNYLKSDGDEAKKSLQWEQSHPSSLKKASKPDITYKARSHSPLNPVLSIFSKYLNYEKTDLADADDDLKFLENYRKNCFSINECYETFGDSKQGVTRKSSLNSKLKNLRFWR
jgi:hypothetical protein